MAQALLPPQEPAPPQAQIPSQEPAADPAARPDHVSIFDQMRLLWAQLQAQLQDHIQLLTLEIQAAVHSALKMLICVLVGALLLIACWLALSAALLFWLVEQGMAMSGAWGLVALVHGLAVAGLMVRYRGYQRDLHFSTSRATTTSRPADTPGPHSGDPL